MLDGVSEKERYSTKKHFPCRVETGVVDIGEDTNCGGIVSRITDWTIKCIGKAAWPWRRGRDGFNLCIP